VDEARKRYWDVALGIVAPLVTVAGVLVGVWQFNTGERNKVRLENELQTRKDVVEFQRKLWLEKLDACRRMVTLAGKIAAAADQHDGHPSAKPAIDDDVWRVFTAAYWGQGLFMEDKVVTESLREFYDTVRDFRDDWAKGGTVKVKANALANACREAIRKNAPEGILI
jgi:hypothetical protein